MSGRIRHTDGNFYDTDVKTSDIQLKRLKYKMLFHT
jgi:hypothetical protein